MKILKSMLFIFFVLIAQTITGFLEFRYLSITMGIFSLILIIFVQGLQITLEYYIFSPDLKILPKIGCGILIVSIMIMNINYLELSRKDFDIQTIKREKDIIYQEQMERYEALLKQYDQEFETYQKYIEKEKDLVGLNYQSEVERYETLLKQYEKQKTFLEKQVNDINGRVSSLQKSLNRWGIKDEEKTSIENEIKDALSQKKGLIDTYNKLIPPEPPKRDNITLATFDKERPIMPNKEDIKIESDKRLELLYWLIAGIIEFGSLALLYLLNNTMNKKKDITIKNNISMVNDNTITTKNIKQNYDLRSDKIEEYIEEYIERKEATKNNQNKNTEVKNNTITNNINAESTKKEIEAINKNIVSTTIDNNEIAETISSINKVNSESKSLLNNKNKIKKTTIEELLIPDDEEIEEENTKIRNENDTEENNVIYVYKENNKKKLTKEAMEMVKNMTIEERKDFAERLSLQLGTPVSFKTLGVWASRDDIPTKKVDAVLKTLNLVEGDEVDFKEEKKAK